MMAQQVDVDKILYTDRQPRFDMDDLTTIQHKQDERLTYQNSSSQEFKFVIEDTGNELSSDEEEGKHYIYNYFDTSSGSTSNILSKSNKEYDEEIIRASSIDSITYQTYQEDEEMKRINFHHKVTRPYNNSSIMSFDPSSKNNNEIELQIIKRPKPKIPDREN